MRAALDQPWTHEITAVFSSDEQKALDGAAILADARGLPHHVIPELGENDRTATGYLEGPEFWETAEAFFDRPEESIRGWERATDAQSRIVAAVTRCVGFAADGKPICIVSHGGVGTLLCCHSKGVPIARSEDQPRRAAGPKGAGGGYRLVIEWPEARLVQGWVAIDS